MGQEEVMGCSASAGAAATAPEPETSNCDATAKKDSSQPAPGDKCASKEKRLSDAFGIHAKPKKETGDSGGDDPNWAKGSATQKLSRVACDQTEDTFLQGGYLFKTLPAGTTSLCVELQQSPKLGDETLRRLAKSMPGNLECLELNLNETGGGELITDEGLIAVIDVLPQSLKVLRLEIYGAKNCTDKVLAVLSDLGARECITDLTLNFGECQGFTDEGVEVLAATIPKNVQRLTYDFENCKG